MENILIKRSKSGSHIHLGDSLHSDSLELKELEKKNKSLLSELSQTQAIVASKQQLLNDLQVGNSLINSQSTGQINNSFY